MSIWLYRPCAISLPPQSAIHKFFEHNIIECRYLNALASVVLPCAASRHTLARALGLLIGQYVFVKRSVKGTVLTLGWQTS